MRSKNSPTLFYLGQHIGAGALAGIRPLLEQVIEDARARHDPSVNVALGLFAWIEVRVGNTAHAIELAEERVMSHGWRGEPTMPSKLSCPRPSRAASSVTSTAAAATSQSSASTTKARPLPISRSASWSSRCATIGLPVGSTATG